MQEVVFCPFCGGTGYRSWHDEDDGFNEESCSSCENGLIQVSDEMVPTKTSNETKDKV